MSDWIDPKKKSISQQRAEGSLYPDDSDDSNRREQSDARLAALRAMCEEDAAPSSLIAEAIKKRAPTKLVGSPGQGKTNYRATALIAKSMVEEKPKELNKEPLPPLSVATLSDGQTTKDVGGRTIILSNLSIAGNASDITIGGIPLNKKLSSRRDTQDITVSEKPKGPKV